MTLFTKPSQSQGTLTHMAPEVLLMSRQSKASDVYSFGILLWELFTAGQPFSDVKMALMGHEIAVAGRRPTFPPFTPPRYARLAERCWATDSGERPSFSEVLEELLALCASSGPTTLPLVVRPPKPIVSSRSSGWSRASLGNPSNPQGVNPQGVPLSPQGVNMAMHSIGENDYY